jgi:hypothetical protein
MPRPICLSEDVIPEGTRNVPANPLDKQAITARLIAQGVLPPDVVDRLS